jgi:uncharacterized protein
MLIKRAMRQIAGIIFVILFTSTVWAGSINDLKDSWKGQDAYMAGDSKTALEIWKTQAEQGNARSSFLLGRLYEMGQGVTKNQDEAEKWYKKSAKLGDSEAQWWLGLIYSAEGRYRAAEYYLRMAAESRDELSQYALGQMYSEGKGVIQDFAQAHMWFNLSAAQNYKPAKKAKDDIEKNMTQNQIAEAQKLAREWIKEHEKE